MANTTNFGWETPDDTDLVKDGAAAMRTLGNSIDSSFVDLKGGTTGQILSKNSNTDLDYVWINNDQGDITAVTAGTGISGGGTSGAVTITNSMATEITASGDIIVGTGSGTFDNLPIGTTGQVLTADTTVSPYKVKWATPSSGGMTLISTTTVSGASTTLSSIPTTYNQLMIELSDVYAGAGGIIMQFNGDATTAAYQQFFTEPSAATVYPTATGWYYYVATSYSITSGSLKNVDMNSAIYITLPNYADSNSRKLIEVIAGFQNAGDSQSLNLNYGWWNNASQITSILIDPNGSWSGGTIKLYGVK